MKVCGTCKHWKPFGTDGVRCCPGFGTCGLAMMHDEYEYKPDVIAAWQFCVVDGSGYFAALKTKESFGCNQWEAQEGNQSCETTQT